jgi:hypothetical protein
MTDVPFAAVSGDASAAYSRCGTPATVTPAAGYLPNDASYTIRGNRCLIAPKVFESLRCQLGVAHRMLNILVPQPSLQCASVVASVG